MSWLKAAVEFLYDFLADDGWEVLVGLIVALPLTYFVAHLSAIGGVLLILLGVLLTLSVSLARQAPKTTRS
ncbi:MAG TPA: hypothetical protein VKU60_03845 [Chloroflexota bacterium]|nr:hypothetical protein [Chloroflexota bacterium]